jgi:hypothetical protein
LKFPSKNEARLGVRFRPGFFTAEMGKYPYAVVRAQRALSPGNFYTAIRGMRPGPAFSQHAPQLREQRQIYEQGDASSAPFFFCMISPKISLSELHKSFIMLREKSALLFRQHHLLE